MELLQLLKFNYIKFIQFHKHYMN